MTLVDDGWEALSAELELGSAALEARIERVAPAALDTFEKARARYTELYGLKLPAGLADLTALINALGALPANPEAHYWEPDPGWQRGNAWLDVALRMRSAGLSDWMAPGGLERDLHEASVLYDEIPNGVQSEGPLDARLDMRYRCDAPQFVTFLGGDSDGLHWGFWYDSPDYFPVIAHNYARDSAETWLDGEAEILTHLRARVGEAIPQTARELASYDADSDLRPYALRRWRALRVVGAHVDALERRSAAQPREEPLCPWPRTSGNPIGSPTLALRPESGEVPAHIPGFSFSGDTPSVEQRQAWIAEARRELDAGRPAYAHALGLYLHWLDADELRAEAGKLLEDAYDALKMTPFAAILRVHLAHRDLRSVGVFKRSS